MILPSTWSKCAARPQRPEGLIVTSLFVLLIFFLASNFVRLSAPAPTRRSGMGISASLKAMRFHQDIGWVTCHEEVFVFGKMKQVDAKLLVSSQSCQFWLLR
jgi:hypothetical protein